VDERATVVVGVDGSEASCAALRYALADAARRSARVRVVRAFAQPEDFPVPYGLPRPPTLEELTARLETATKTVVESVASEPGLGGVPVDVVAVQGSSAKVLVDEARDADLLVVGHRGLGGVASRLLGSVGLACVLHASCPVTIVRHHRNDVPGSGAATSASTSV
jgi:nucleotide-binding universal stress UspA family protein